MFSKIQALRLPYRQLVFLDLDLVPRRDLTPLFDVPAPAGMHHGDHRGGGRLEHGEVIETRTLGGRWWCINAGVMRLDPAPSARARRRGVRSMVSEVKQLRYKTALPEQYFLAGRLKGWRHLDSAWNMEVGPAYEDPGFTWPRELAQKAAEANRGRLWFQQAIDEVKVFHFSGTKMHPWLSMDQTPQEAHQEALAEWRHRDPRQLVATAVLEWRTALEEVTKEVKDWKPLERHAAQAACGRLRRWAAWERASRREAVERTLQCRRCEGLYGDGQGRWLLGWEGWWLCYDCIVGYIFSEEEPDALRCTECGGDDGTSRTWRWTSGQPSWYCGSCWPTAPGEPDPDCAAAPAAAS